MRHEHDNNNFDVDLHLHTTRSDGSLTPEEVVEKALAGGLSAIALTDHDDIGVFPDIIEYAKVQGLEVLPGVELSVHFRNRDIHILGYCFDTEDQGLQDYLSIFKEERTSRARRIVDKLLEMGIAISFEEVMSTSGEGSVGRPHIARLLVEHGYVYSFNEAFDKFIGDGRPAYVQKYRLEIQQALKLIRNAGGVCSIAHPGIQLSDDDVIALVKHGAGAIEVIHPKHDRKKTRCYARIAEELDVIGTGGSDFHGGKNGSLNFGRYNVSYEVVSRLKAISGYYKTRSV